MTNLPPPYRPLRGAEPPHFADRADEDDLDGAGLAAGCLAAYSVGPRDPRFHRIVHGGPAMGKTALLRAVRRQVAIRLGWAVAQHRCRRKESLAQAVVLAALSALGERGAGVGRAGRLCAMAAHPSSGATLGRWPGGGPIGSSWESTVGTLRAVGQLCLQEALGLVVTLDDADRAAPAELQSMGFLAAALSAEGLPVALLVAGNRRAAQVAAGQGTPVWAWAGEPFWPSQLNPLGQAEATEAVVVPALDRGVDFDQAGARLLGRAAAGSPLELQRLAFSAWSLARRPGRVALADAEAAVDLAALTDVPQAS